jgi:hypothetical protein
MPPSSSSCAVAFELDDREQGIFDALVERHSDLASMYRAALRLLRMSAEDGDRRMRVAHICHAMREVMNRFPDAMGSEPVKKIKPSTSLQVQALPDLLADHPELVLDQDQEFVPIPRPVAAAFDKLIKASVREKIRTRDIAASLLTDDGDAAHPAVGQWMNARDFFVRWAHMESTATDPSKLPTDDEIRRWTKVVEDLIEGVTKLFFDARRSVDDLLEEINRTADSDG